MPKSKEKPKRILKKKGIMRNKKFNIYFIEDWMDKQKKKLKKRIINNFRLIGGSVRNLSRFLFGILIFMILLKPIFNIGIMSGLFLVITFLYVLIIKTEIIIDSPTYFVLVFIILAIRAFLFPLLFDGIKDLKWGIWFEGGIFILVWILIYIKTRELQKH